MKLPDAARIIVAQAVDAFGMLLCVIANVARIGFLRRP